MSDDYYKDDEEITMNEDAKQFLQEKHGITFKLNEEDYLILNQLIEDYNKEICGCSDSVDNLKRIYKFLKEKNIIRKREDGIATFSFSFLEYHPIYNSLIDALLNNIINPQTINEPEISIKCLFCFCSGKDILPYLCDKFQEENSLFCDIIIKALNEDLPGMVYFISLIEMITKNIDDYSIFTEFDLSASAEYLEKPLVSERRWILRFLYDISEQRNDNEFQHFILQNVVDKYPSSSLYYDIMRILLNIIRSESFNSELFMDFFEYHQNNEDFPLDMTFFWLPFQKGEFNFVILPNFTILYFYLLMKNEDFANYLPIAETCRSIFNHFSENEYNVEMKNEYIHLFKFILCIIIASNINQEFKNTVAIETYHIIEHMGSLCTIEFKLIFLKLIYMIIPLLLPDKIEPDDFRGALDFILEVLQAEQDKRNVVHVCSFLCTIHQIITTHGLNDIEGDIRNEDLLREIYDAIDEAHESDPDIENNQIIQTFRDLFD